MSTTCQASARMLTIVHRIQACFPGADALLGRCESSLGTAGGSGGAQGNYACAVVKTLLAGCGGVT